MAKILVVEDNDDVREMMAITLQLEGYKVTTAVNGHEALEKLRSGLKPGLILLDLMMPGMDGWEFRRALQREPSMRDISVVVISAATGDLLSRAVADAYLPKPIDMDQLLDVVSELCDGGEAAAVSGTPVSSYPLR
jgi:CheY-like chemotaxis protein